MAHKKAARKGGRRTGGTTARRASTQGQGSSRRQAAKRQAAAKRGGGSRSPTAIRLLKQDHQEVSQLLKRFEKAKGGDKTQIAQRICSALTVHAQIEEELLYPAARRALKDDDRELVAEANVEHASIKDLIGQIESARSSDELYDAKVKVLGEYVKHHVNEEETELFPKLQKSELDLDALGGELAARKAELLSSLGMQRAGMEEESEDESEITPPRPGGNRANRPAARNS